MFFTVIAVVMQKISLDGQLPHLAFFWYGTSLQNSYIVQLSLYQKKAWRDSGLSNLNSLGMTIT